MLRFLRKVFAAYKIGMQHHENDSWAACFKKKGE